jgi:16S rRNA (guanine966-N2)-methyltransferase
MIFNMLAHSPWAQKAGFSIQDMHVLDGFCGSGALGIEALSRGAASCLFVDLDRKVLDIARANITVCGYEKKSVFLLRSCDAFGAKSSETAPKNLVFLDPPYRKDLALPALCSLYEGGWLAPRALIVAETEKNWRGDVPSVFENLLVRTDGDSQWNVWYLTAS